MSREFSNIVVSLIVSLSFYLSVERLGFTIERTRQPDVKKVYCKEIMVDDATLDQYGGHLPGVYEFCRDF